MGDNSNCCCRGAGTSRWQRLAARQRAQRAAQGVAAAGFLIGQYRLDFSHAMAQQSATLHGHVTQLATCLEELQQQRAALVGQAREEEAERTRLAQDAAVLQRRLCQLEASLEKKQAAKEAFDRVIDQTQTALSRLVDSSHMLLTVTKRNAAEVAALSPLRTAGTAAAAPSVGGRAGLPS